MNLLQSMAIGVAAGAAGTAALNIATYLDMTVRARPASGVPAKTGEQLARRAGLDLASDGPDPEKLKNRESGLGALLGYGVGLGIGLGYGLVRPMFGDRVSRPLVSAALAAAAMASSDVPAVAVGSTDPSKWGPTG